MDHEVAEPQHSQTCLSLSDGVWSLELGHWSFLSESHPEVRPIVQHLSLVLQRTGVTFSDPRTQAFWAGKRPIVKFM